MDRIGQTAGPSQGPPPPPTVWSIDPLSGEMVGFPSYPPGDFVWEFRPEDNPSQWTRFHIHTDEDGRPWVVSTEYVAPGRKRILRQAPVRLRLVSLRSVEAPNQEVYRRGWTILLTDKVTGTEDPA